MYERHTVLDHGYLQVIELYGSDQRVIEAARMSTQKGFEGWGPKCDECGESGGNPKGLSGNPCPNIDCNGLQQKSGDEKLLAYLWKNNHRTPFEMAGLIIEVQAPIFVVREWHRHRTQGYNEASARYEALPDMNYIPSVQRILMGGGHLTKQAGAATGAKELNSANAQIFRNSLEESYRRSQQLYEWALENGIPKELARVHLPVGRYTKMRATANLRNWLAFLELRYDSKAQWEIREYARVLHGELTTHYPRTLALFDAHRFGGV